MKRILSALLIVLFVMCGYAQCESSRADDAVVFETAVDLLKQMDSRESIEDAQSMFQGIASNYNQSKSFGIYTSAVLDIYDEVYDNAEAKLAILELDSGFIELLQNYGLQSCDVLKKYIQASRLETSGDIIGAFQIYTTIQFKDALGKSIALIGLVYNDAMEAFNSGDYERAATAFELLGSYKDSAEMAEKATELIVPPKPETDEIGDSWNQIISAIDDGTAKQRYAVGATKELDLGKIGVVHMQLAGYELDERADGKGKASTTWIAVELLPEKRQMNQDEDYLGGWEASDLRDYIENSVYAALPDEIRRSLITVKKEQRIGIFDMEGLTITERYQATEDRVWIPDEREICGRSSLYYDLFRDEDAKRVKTLNGSVYWWWLRSGEEPSFLSAINYVINYGGYNVYNSATNAGGVAIGFCL